MTKLFRLLFEGSNTVLLNVDIQLEALPYIKGFDINDWVRMLNKNASSDIIFLYNGYDTVGQVKEADYKYWLIYELGIEESIVENALFVDKGYGFYRSCMDQGIDDDVLLRLLKFMYENDIYDSRDLNEEDIDEDMKEILEVDPIYIPRDLIEFLKRNIMSSNIILMGGGLDECLREIELSLMMLDKEYRVDRRFVY